MKKKLIVVSNVSKSHGDHHTLRCVNLEISQGEIAVICGPSGAGKTSLLRVINGLDMVDAGDVIVDGQHLSSSKTDLSSLRAKIGMVFQHLNLYPHMTVLKNIMLAPQKVKQIAALEARELAMRLLTRVGLEHKRDAYPAQLSGGEMQRVAIARSLAMDPKILLLDEPTSALDPELTKDILDLVTDLAKDDITMVVVTHEMVLAHRIADRIIFMDEGQIIEVGKPSDVVTNPQHERTKQFMSKILHGPASSGSAPTGSEHARISLCI